MIEAIKPYIDEVVTFIANNTAMSATIVAWLSSWVLYGVLGKKYLGANDDFWEKIRAYIIPILDKLADKRGLYVETSVNDDEFAGSVSMTEEKFERKLQEAGFMRQPLASMHKNSLGWMEDGSWSRTHGMMFPVAVIAGLIPVAGGPLKRFINSLDTILARRQLHIIYFTRESNDNSRVYVYAHDEPNPINPLTAFHHYTAVRWRAAPEMARKALKQVGVDLDPIEEGEINNAN